ncbi:uncharacterized protein LOC134817305 isoform X2 [Bolinopsis microptera]|uniref:uncharacterized protein LOC134817305 isoform X2 n=1 Tax=Bolinopsis microptera TaxID=2820187 RepID=UPI003078B5CD
MIRVIVQLMLLALYTEGSLQYKSAEHKTPTTFNTSCDLIILSTKNLVFTQGWEGDIVFLAATKEVLTIGLHPESASLAIKNDVFLGDKEEWDFQWVEQVFYPNRDVNAQWETTVSFTDDELVVTCEGQTLKILAEIPYTELTGDKDTFLASIDSISFILEGDKPVASRIYYTLSCKESCAAGQRFDQSNGCVECPEDTWSVAGNKSPSCTDCPEGKGVAAGQGKHLNDCTWKSCAAGQRLDQVDGCVNCPDNQWSSDGNNAATCQICPSGKVVAAGEGRKESDCAWEPCDAGQFLHQSIGCVECPEDTWSVAGNTSPSCTACPEGKGVAAGEGKKESDCACER